MGVKQDHKRWRIAFNQQCSTRDGNRCAMCGRANVKISVHHITDRHEMPNGGYSRSNGISLCDDKFTFETMPQAMRERLGIYEESDFNEDCAMSCHERAEIFHASGEELWMSGYLPDDLYKRIGSSFEQAKRDSESLR
jgi:hypothetical protein